MPLVVGFWPSRMPSMVYQSSECVDDDTLSVWMAVGALLSVVSNQL